MKKGNTICKEMLIRDIVLRYPQVLKVLIEHRIDPCYANLTVGSAALASGCDPDSLVGSLNRVTKSSDDRIGLAGGKGGSV